MNIPSVADYAVKHTRRLILEGQLLPGEHVTEEKIAKRLGISRPPVREAFKVLEVKGLLQREARRGVFIADFDEEDIYECFMLRKVLYSLAISICVERATAKDISRLKKIANQMERCANTNSPNIHKYQNLNNLFHSTTIRITGFDRLRTICESLDDQMRRFSFFPLKESKEYLLKSSEYHREMVRAIQDRNLGAALKLSEGHIQAGFEIVCKNYRERKEYNGKSPDVQKTNHPAYARNRREEA
jgi:DNA-binding GntR family transcriptional regulator